MKNQYKQIQKLNQIKGITLEKGLCKLFEEAGELAQAVNVDIGIKKGDPTKVRANVLEECADSIQNIMSIANLYQITFDELTQSLNDKNQVWATSKGRKPKLEVIHKNAKNKVDKDLHRIIGAELPLTLVKTNKKKSS